MLSRKGRAAIAGQGGGGPVGLYHSDSFTDSDGVLLSAHTPEIGNGYSFPYGSIFEINANAARSSVAGAIEKQVITDVGHSDQLDVSCLVRTGTANWQSSAGIMVRMSDVVGKAILLYQGSTYLRFFQYSGAWTAIGPANMPFSPLASAQYRLRITVDGSSLVGTTEDPDGTIRQTVMVSNSLGSDETNCGLRTYNNGAILYDDFVIKQLGT